MNKEYKQIKNDISSKIYKYPIIITILISSLFLLLSFSYINNLKNKEFVEIKNHFLNKEKLLAKTQVDNFITEINFATKSINLELKNRIKNRIYEAKSIINNIINSNKDSNQKEIRKKVIKILSAIRFFDNRGYYFIYDNKSKIILSHARTDFIGKDMTNFKDKSGQVLVDLFDEKFKIKNEAFIENTYFVKPDSNSLKEYKKSLFVMYIKELDIVIGTGEYYSDVENIIKKRLLQRIESIRYSKNGYLWVHDDNYNLLAHPYRQNDIGKNDKNLKDSKGTNIVQMFLFKSKLKPNGAFVEYYWSKPNSKYMEKKIGYVKYIKKWHWVIGTGVYIKDINIVISKEEKKFDKQIQIFYIKFFFIVCFVLFIVIFISRKLSKKVQNEFDNYTNSLNKLNDSLEKKVNIRTKKLENLNQELENKIKLAVQKNKEQQEKIFEHSKNAQMGELIENIAHQWRQPLSIISTAASGIIFSRELNNLSVEKENEMLNVILYNTKELSKTIDIFREYLNERNEFKDVILQDRLNIAINIIKTSLYNNQIELINDIDKTKPINIKIILGDISQIIVNIVNNSKDAAIFKNIKNPYVKIYLEEYNKSIAICIEDNAGGIDNSIINKVFDPYFTTKHKTQGTGLGLYLCKEIVEKHMNGRIDVENIKNGVLFKIVLPLN
jgi:signal transduction histidine kinase